MFVADTLTAWVEAFRETFHSADYVGQRLHNIPVHAEFPMSEADYPGLWINYTMQGDLKNVGIGHKEYVLDEDSKHMVQRWQFGGVVEVTLTAMTNLERGLLFDELTRVIAVGRDEEHTSVLRDKIEHSDLIGQIVTWDSFGVGGWGESSGTPWGTDDVIYEVTITLTSSGEVVLRPDTRELVPLSAVLTEVSIEGTEILPSRGNDGWI